MASLPLPPQNTRRASHSTTQSSHVNNDLHSIDITATQSTSDNIPLGSSSSSEYSFLDASPPTAETRSASPPRQSVSIPEEAEPRRCWICFSDDTEDTPESGIWRTPCGCNLTAHEPCLLQWIADIEAPKQDRSAAAPANIQCPQCKMKIHLARPRSYIVEAVGALEYYNGRALLPVFVLGMGYTILLGLSHHGAHTIRMIFGAEEAAEMLAPLQPSQWSYLERQAMLQFPAVAKPLFRGWRGLRVELGLPVIPAAIMASRTSLADAILPILPIVFFATHPKTSGSLSLGYWPPSSALTFVVLPYIRSAYDMYMDTVWRPHERRWLKEVKPQLTTEDAAAAARNGVDADADAEDEDEDDDGADIINIEIDMDMNIFGGGDDDGDNDQIPDLIEPDSPIQAAVDADPLQAPPLHAPPQDDLLNFPIDIAADAAPAPDVPQQAPQPPQPAVQPAAQPAQPRHQHHRREIDIISSARRVSQLFFGALLFPSISAGCGELLRLLLPLSWTVPTKRMLQGPMAGSAAGGILDRILWGSNAAMSGSGEARLVPTGLLQTRWGRTVVGGCLFVVIKDMVRVYCRWRMAVSFRERKVLDYDRKRGKVEGIVPRWLGG